MVKHLTTFFLRLAAIFTLLAPIKAHAQEPEIDLSASLSKLSLQKADSLFSTKNLNEAYEIYQGLLFERQVYSPQMLLKMASYCELQNDYTFALYYLNRYYVLNPGISVREKIQDLAVNQSLVGYTFSELDFLIFLFYQYYIFINATLLLGTLTFLGIIIFRRYKRKPLIYYHLFFIAFITATLILTNFGYLYRRGIIKKDNTYLFGGPSAGAGVKFIVSKGHKLVVREKNDIWWKVIWKDQEVWCLEENLLMLEN